MLRLLAFLPCEKIIISEEQITSIISMIEALHVQRNPALPLDAIIPMPWSVLTLWHRTPESMGRTYEQRVELIRPDGVAIGGGNTRFQVTEQHLNYRNTVAMNGLPIGIAGTCHIRLSLREEGEGNPWQEITTYPFSIIHDNAVTPDNAEPPTNTPAVDT